MASSVSTVFTYRGYNFDIGNKPAGATNFFLESTPTLEEFRRFLEREYRDVTITPDEKPNTKPNEQPQLVTPQITNLEFGPKPKFEYPQIPYLKPLKHGPIANDLIMERIHIMNSPGGSYEFNPQYAENTLQRARRVHEILSSNDESRQRELDRLAALKDETDRYEEYIKKYSVDSAHRQHQQRHLNDLVQLLVADWNL